MESPRPYICRLCLFKSEIADGDENYIESGQELGAIITELFNGKIVLAKSELDVICFTCRHKLRSIQEYFGFVLENQFKFKNKVTDNRDNDKLSVIKESHQPVPIRNSASSDSNGIFEQRQLGFSVKQEPVSTDDELELELINHPAPLTPPTSIDENEDEEELTSESEWTRTHLTLKPEKARLSGYKSRLSPEKLQLRQEQNNLIQRFLTLTCSLCPQLPPFLDFTKLSYHMKKIHNKILEVPCCGKIFRTKQTYFQHLVKQHSGEGTGSTTQHFCPECKKSFSTPCKLQVHRYISHFYCHLCKKKVSNVRSQSSLRSHLQQHALSKDPTKLEMYKCHHCMKEFIDRDKITVHLKTVHLSTEGTICHKCGIEFKSRSACNLHNQRHHESVIPRVPCPICHIVVKKIYLDDHIRNKHEVHSTPCPVCGEVFKSRKLMATHLVKHTNRHQCQVCSKSFSTPKSLREHEAVHTGKALYMCQYCGAEFKSGGNYNAHRRRLHPIEYATAKARRHAQKFKI